MDYELPLRNEISNKGTYGRVLNMSGSKFMPGAAYLSSVAALTAGCGYVFLVAEDSVISAVAAQTQNVVFAPFHEIKKLLKTSDALLLGCGITTSWSASSDFEYALNKAPNIPTIIDADGLNILSEMKKYNLPPKTILTPHVIEAARLLKVKPEKVIADMETSAKEISKKYDCTTVLKSETTIVCSKELEIYKLNKPNSALAKAGSGDVLSGIIAGLSAQGLDEFNAAKTGVYLHSLSGELAKNDLTEYGVLASDTIRYIPYAFKKLLT